MSDNESGKNESRQSVEKKPNWIIRGFLFVLGIIVASYIGYIFRKHVEEPAERDAVLKAEVRKIWRTLNDEDELIAEQDHPSGSFIDDLKTISLSQKSPHERDWDKHIKGLPKPSNDSDLDQVSVLVEAHRFLAKKHHKETYEIANLIETQKFIEKSGRIEIVANYPLVLDELIFSNLKLDSDAAPIAMFNGYAYMKKDTSNFAQQVPHIDLSNESERLRFSEIADESGDKTFLAMAKKKSGFVVPRYPNINMYKNCFQTDIGLVRVNKDKEECKQYANQYFKMVKALQKKVIASGADCKLPTISLDSVNFDPCKTDSEFTANLTCKSTVDAYLRKVKANPDKDFDTHLNFIRNSCREYVTKHRSAEEREIIMGSVEPKGEK